MARRDNRYKQMERNLTYILLFSSVMFVIFLITSGIGVFWGKAITSILSILSAVLVLGFLYLSRELLRTRSLWMTVAAVAIIACTLFSLMLGYPSPNPLN